MAVDLSNQGFQKNLAELSLMASEAEKAAMFNTNLLKWEIKTQNTNAAFRRAQLILLKRNEASAYKYVAERLQLWEREFANDDKRVKHYNIAKKVKELNDVGGSIDNTLTFVALRDLLLEINALDESFQAVAKTEVDIKKDAVAFLRDFTKDEELDVEWLKTLGEYEKKVGFLETSNINNENKWEENCVRYTPIPSLTSGAGSLGGLSHRFAMPEEINNFCRPLGPFIDRWRTMPTTAQSKQINIPAGGLRRNASLNRHDRADANTGAERNPSTNEGPAFWSKAPQIAPKPQNRLMVHPTNLEEQAPSPANANLPVGRQVYRNLSRLVDGEFKAFSPVSGGKWRPDLFPRRTETCDHGEARNSPSKSENHQNANADAMEPPVKKEETLNTQCRTKLLALLADSDDEIEHIHNLQTEPASTKFSHSTSVKTLAHNFENEADPIKKAFVQELLGRSQNLKSHGKPTPPMTEWSYQMPPPPRVIYHLARTQTAETSGTKETPLRKPSPQRFENAKSKVYQIAGLRQPVNCYTPRSADVSYSGKENNMDSHTQNSQVRAAQLMNCNAGRKSPENLLEINNEVVPDGPESSFAGRASYMSQSGNCPNVPSNLNFDEWRKQPAYKPDVIRQWAHSHLQTPIGSYVSQACGLRQQSPTGFTVLLQRPPKDYCRTHSDSARQPQLSFMCRMTQSRDETVKDWLLRVRRNVGTAVPTADQQRACRSIFLSGLREGFNAHLQDPLAYDLNHLAAKLDGLSDNGLETKLGPNVPDFPRPVTRMRT